MILSILIQFFFLKLLLAFTPQLIEIDSQIRQLQSRNIVLSQNRYAKTKPISHLPRYQYKQIELNQKCSFNATNINSFLFQTPSNIYFAINFPQLNVVRIYNSECEVLAEVHDQIEYVLKDRGIVQNGIVYLVTRSHQLYHSYEQNNFKNWLKLRVLSPGQIVGGLVRYRGKDRVQIFMVYRQGTIQQQCLDVGCMTNRVIQKSQIQLLADHHPYPLVVTRSNWISMIDTNKYIQIDQKCPYIEGIKSIFSQNYYGDTIYLINSLKIYALSFEVNKKICTIKRQYVLEQPINQINTVAYFSYCLFIDNKVYNMTARKMYQRDDCHQSGSIHFISKRNQHDKDYAMKNCCGVECSMVFYQMKRTQKDKNIFIWLTLSFIVVIFISFSLMKKSKVRNIDIEEDYQLGQMKEKQILNQKKYKEKNKKKK